MGRRRQHGAWVCCMAVEAAGAVAAAAEVEAAAAQLLAPHLSN
jgi:hypothetical protein